MKSLRYISAIICIILTLTVFTGCSKKDVSLLITEKSTTKKAFNQAEFDAEWQRTSVEESETEATEGTTKDDTAETGAVSTTKPQQNATVTEKVSEITSVIITSITEQISGETSATAKQTTTRHKVSKDSTTQEKKTDYKYGVVKIDVTSTYYDVYSDGTKVQSDVKTYTKYDASKYKATTTELLPEAKSNKAKYASEIASAVALINSYRSSNGAATLTLDDSLSDAAAVRATEMAYSGKLGSTRPDKTNYRTVYSDIGYTYENAIELTCKGYSGADGAVGAWKNGSSSADAMTNSTYKKIGVGVAQAPDGSIYWCVEFSD